MANCFGFRCFRSEREGRASTPDPQTGSSQQSVSSPALQQAASSQETPPPPSLAEVKAQLEAVNNVNNVDELIKITQDFLEWRIAGMNVEDKAESSESVALRFIGTGETFFKFLTDHAEKSSNKGDFVKSVSRIIGDVLANLENVNWLVAGLSVIGYMLFTHNERSERYKRCLDLLQKLVDLSALVKKLDYRLRKQEEKLRKATVVIVKGCILCASQSSSHKLSRLLKDVVSGEDLNSLDKEIHDLHMDLNAAEQGLVTHSHIPPPFPHMDVNTEEQGIVTHSLIPPPFPDYAVVTSGFEKGQEKVIELLQLTSTDTLPMAVVIYGFGGIGKTTLAEAVVAKIDLEHYHYSRVNFDILSSRKDIRQMQETLLDSLFPKSTKTKFTDCLQGRTVLAEAFKKEGNEPIFLFIDNALRKQDLEELLPRDMKGLPKGSRILVTTRYLGTTDMFIEDEAGLERQHYHVQPLSDQDAKNFFLKGCPDRLLDDSQEDVQRILNVCKGVPLVLKIFRGHFRKQRHRADNCRQILEALERGEKITKEDLSTTLTDFVYDQMEESSQQAFLDICCFFYDMDPSKVESIVGAWELTSLEEAAFVQRSDDKETLIVHDIIRKRGRNKAESTRIMNIKSLTDAANMQRLEDIRGVWLKYEPEYVVEELFLKAMRNLRVLALGKRMSVSQPCEVTFKELRYLEVGGDIPCLPNLERLPKLVFYHGPLFKNWISLTCLKYLDLSYCNALECLPEPFGQLAGVEILILSCTDLQCLSKSFGELKTLKYLHLSYCKALERLPESFGQLAALEKIMLSRCTAFQRLPKSFGELKALKDLHLSSCEALEWLPESFGELKALEYLDLSSCKALERLPESFGELKGLKYLNLSYCIALERLPESFGQMRAVEELILSRCTVLQCLPESFCKLQALEYLDMESCEALERLPESFWELNALKYLDLSYCKVKRLPQSFGQLAAVVTLKLSHCRALECLPESFGELKALKFLDLSWCNALEGLPESFGQLGALKALSLYDCEALQCLPESFGELTALQDLYLSYCKALERLPESFGQLAAMETLKLSRCTALQCLPVSFGELKALKDLDLGSCEALELLPESFGELKSLKDLDLGSCEALKGLPESFGQLAAVEKIMLRGCTALQCLPESLGELKALKDLNLASCEVLERLPKSFGELTSLLYINMADCPARADLRQYEANLKYVIIDP